MAIDQALLAARPSGASGGSGCTAGRRTASRFGRHEPAARRYDAKRESRRWAWPRAAPDGGRAVWHADELTYAVAATRRRRWVASAKPTPRSMACCATRLRRLGAAVGARRRAVRRSSWTPAPVSPRPAGGEVMVGAGRWSEARSSASAAPLLQHGTILLERRPAHRGRRDPRRGTGRPRGAASRRRWDIAPGRRRERGCRRRGGGRRWSGRWITARPRRGGRCPTPRRSNRASARRPGPGPALTDGDAAGPPCYIFAHPLRIAHIGAAVTRGRSEPGSALASPRHVLGRHPRRAVFGATAGPQHRDRHRAARPRCRSRP